MHTGELIVRTLFHHPPSKKIYYAQSLLPQITIATVTYLYNLLLRELMTEKKKYKKLLGQKKLPEIIRAKTKL